MHHLRSTSPIVSSLPWLGTLAALLAAAPLSATPISASMAAGVKSTVYDGIAPSSTGPGFSTESWVATPSTLGVSATSTASSGGGTVVTAYAGGSATWAANGNSGTVSFRYGWNGIEGGDYVLTSVQTNRQNPNWSYSFTADASGFFTMTYEITAPGGLPSFGGLQNFYIGSSGGSTLNLFDVGSGTFTQSVVAGQTYNVAFQNNGNAFDEVLPYGAGVEATFSWTLPGEAAGGGGATGNPVPDSGATAALLAGALLGLFHLPAVARPGRR